MNEVLDFNLGLQAKVTDSGYVLVFTKLYVVRGMSDEFGLVDIGFYLKRSDAEDGVSLYSSNDRYKDVYVVEETLFV